MKIGISSYSFSKMMRTGNYTYRQLCDITKKIGYDGIEFVSLQRTGMSDDAFATARDLRQYCADIGLEIVAYTVGDRKSTRLNSSH